MVSVSGSLKNSFPQECEREFEELIPAKAKGENVKMPLGYKIALFGTGHLRSIAYAGMATLTYCEAQNEKAKNSAFDFDILKCIEPVDYTSLVKAYKKVQRKYYPKKDVLVK